MYIKFLSVVMVFEFKIFIGIDFHSFAPDSETAFCPIAVFQQFMYKTGPFQVILCDTLLRRSKYFFTIETADPWRFSYLRDASFSYKMLLKLIHLKSFN